MYSDLADIWRHRKEIRVATPCTDSMKNFQMRSAELREYFPSFKFDVDTIASRLSN